MSKSHLCCCSWSLLHTGWQHTHLCLHYNINTTHVELIPPALAPIICCLFYISYQELETFTATQVDQSFSFGNDVYYLRIKFDRFYYRAMLCIRGTSHGPVSVCLSVCLSQVGVLLKRLNTGSHKQHHTIAQGLQFSVLTPKISAKFDRGHPLLGRRMQVRWANIGDFWQITGYISKPVQDRHIVSIKVE